VIPCPTSALLRGGSLRSTRPYLPGYGFPMPFGWQPSLLGTSSPPRPLCRPHGGPTGRAGLSRSRCQSRGGFPRSPPVRCGRGGCPLYSGAMVPAHDVSGASCLSPAAPSWLPIIPALSLDEASSRIHSRSPVRPSRSPVWPDGSAVPWTLSPASHPVVTDDACRDSGQALGTCLGLGWPPIPLTMCDLVSRPLLGTISPASNKPHRG